MPLIWGLIISVALYPVFLKLKRWLKGRNTLTGVVFILVSLALVLVPTVLLTDSIIHGATSLSKGLEEGTLSVPPPYRKGQGVAGHRGKSSMTDWSQMSRQPRGKPLEIYRPAQSPG